MSDLESKLEPVNVYEKYAPETVVRTAIDEYHRTIDEIRELSETQPDPRISRLASIALTNAHERFKMVQDSAARFIEPTTGLLTRETFAHELFSDADDMLVGNRPHIALYVIDLNNLKLINDTSGHDEGDWYLGIVGQGIKRFGNDGYKAGRIGGDEIGVIEPAHRTDFDTIKLALEAEADSYARSLIEKDPARYEETLARTPVGVAMGRGELTPGAYRELGERPSIGEVLAASGADREMYEHKRAMKGPAGSYR